MASTSRPRLDTTPATPPSSSDNDVQQSVELAFGVIVMILNIVEIILICRIKRKKQIYEIFILSLSVTDLLFGLSNVIVAIVYLSDNARHEEVLELSYTTYFYFGLNSIFHLTWIALDRLWAVYKPFQYKFLVTRKRVFILIGITWIASTMSAGSLYAVSELTETFVSNTTTISYKNVTVNETKDNETEVLNMFNTTLMTPLTSASEIKSNRTQLEKILNNQLNAEYKQTMQLVLSIFIILADVLLITSYAVIVYLLQKKKSNSVINSMGNENHVSIICVSIAATFVLFTLPYALSRLAVGRVNFWVSLILLSNSGLNSIVYFFFGKCEQYQEISENNQQLPVASSALSTAPPTPIELRRLETIPVSNGKYLSTN